ncbi:BV10 family protein [Diolcogaster facetosa bracovirus]|uniref:BV10 family protein n=2 Tax=Bracoviriform TaxID=2946836 RepID=R9XLD2_9VIRU|nr:BV10 family protein [Diolcogaster facetosa bracovirus] [Bracoviriform facetosae]AGO14368.1 BV10 family protein [Diolcogaster facetosa bracovirus] [Bracoviriform facetosae]AGO14442.1 BV10 family protein [Cotesia sesamiae Mombasa bracovirus]
MTTVTKIKRFFNQLGCVGFKDSTESNKDSDLKTGYLGDPNVSGDFEYLRTRRRWSRILFTSKTEESSFYGGIALKLLVSQGKCDLKICDLSCHSK